MPKVVSDGRSHGGERLRGERKRRVKREEEGGEGVLKMKPNGPDSVTHAFIFFFFFFLYLMG